MPIRAPAFWNRQVVTGLPAVLLFLLLPLAAVYHRVVQHRLGKGCGWQAPVPVICVGNLTAGGTGKTPVVADLLKRCAELGVQAATLSRGYGGRMPGPLCVDPEQHTAGDVGDEPLLLARNGKAWIARSRVAGAKAAVAAGAQAIILDDGFQNPALVKDLSLIVVDGGVGFGNGHVIPAGPLREPVANGLARADAMIVIGEDRRHVAADCRTQHPDLPILFARIQPAPESLAALRNHPLLAFAGIGRPEKFFDTLREAGLEVVRTRSFPDHHPYTADEMTTLLAEARQAKLLPVTTAKDHVRLPPELREAVAVLPVHLLWDDPLVMNRLLAGLPRQGNG